MLAWLEWLFKFFFFVKEENEIFLYYMFPLEDAILYFHWYLITEYCLFYLDKSSGIHAFQGIYSPWHQTRQLPYGLRPES
jgi:hypothetical protein